jgi:hypothetical protein
LPLIKIPIVFFFCEVESELTLFLCAGTLFSRYLKFMRPLRRVTHEQRK